VVRSRAVSPNDPITVAYGPGPQQFGHLRLPSGRGAFPVLVNIHGGFWRAQYDLAHASDLCVELTSAHGLATLNLEYRRPGQEGGGFPATLDDVRAGFDVLAEIAAEHSLDLGRVVVMGHSAGGQLALFLAAHRPGLRGVVSLAGVVDLEEGWRLGLSDVAGDSAVAAFLGGTPDEVPGRYAEADPMRLAIRPPQRLLHGARDRAVPVSVSRGYVDAKSRRGEDVHFVELEDTGHFDVIKPGSAAWGVVAKTVLSLTAAPACEVVDGGPP
jgi:acetyl esterase/lipase